MDRILIIEDDENINNFLKEALNKEGYHCEQTYSGTEGLRLTKQENYDLILLDLMLPGLSGEHVLSQIRQSRKIPVIVLTAKDGMDTKLELLTKGADDYITKPFEIREVIARVKIQLRHKDERQEDSILSYGDLTLDKEDYSVRINNQKVQDITKREFAILELFLKHPRKVYSKEEVFEYAWGEPFVGETKTLDVHISNIRRKMKKLSDREYIETIWAIGYKLSSPEKF